jgi:hypothetical protein
VKDAATLEAAFIEVKIQLENRKREFKQLKAATKISMAKLEGDRREQENIVGRLREKVAAAKKSADDKVNDVSQSFFYLYCFVLIFILITLIEVSYA